MSLVNDPNYTSPVQATYHSADSDVYSRNDSYTAFLTDLSTHNHRTTKGLGVGRAAATAIAATANTGEFAVETGGLQITDGTTKNDLLDCKQNGYSAYLCLGLTGATAASRYVGATTTGAPASGTFLTGDFVVAQDGNIQICTAGGTPGTWKGAGKLTAGTITDWGGDTTDPSGAFLNDGRAISRTTYAAAFAVTSTKYGAGDGTTTFNLPDKRDRVWMGADNMNTAAGAAARASGSVALGNTSGEDTHTLTTAELAAHNHSHTHGLTDAGHNHSSVNGGDSTMIFNGTSANNTSLGGSTTVATAPSTLTSTNATGISMASDATSAGSGTAHNNRPLTQIVNSVLWT